MKSFVGISLMVASMVVGTSIGGCRLIFKGAAKKAGMGSALYCAKADGSPLPGRCFVDESDCQSWGSGWNAGASCELTKDASCFEGFYATDDQNNSSYLRRRCYQTEDVCKQEQELFKTDGGKVVHECIGHLGTTTAVGEREKGPSNWFCTKNSGFCFENLNLCRNTAFQLGDSCQEQFYSYSFTAQKADGSGLDSPLFGNLYSCENLEQGGFSSGMYKAADQFNSPCNYRTNEYSPTEFYCEDATKKSPDQRVAVCYEDPNECLREGCAKSEKASCSSINVGGFIDRSVCAVNEEECNLFLALLGEKGIEGETTPCAWITKTEYLKLP